MYNWRKMTDHDRREALDTRKSKYRPWHSPPHRFLPGDRQYIISAACFEHTPIIGATTDRMHAFTDELLKICDTHAQKLFAWCVLPNHYHVVLQTAEVKMLLADLGLLHGRSSYYWNGHDDCRGRQVWFNAVEREMRSPAHLWASINYVHHNPVKHGWVKRWQDWPWSSARRFLEETGLDEAKRIWQAYPIKDYGKGWDD